MIVMIPIDPKLLRLADRSRTLPESKTKRFHSRVSKLYLELTIGYPRLQTHELVRPPAGRRPIPLIVDVGSVRCTGRLAVDLYVKRTGCDPGGTPIMRYTSRA